MAEINLIGLTKFFFTNIYTFLINMQSVLSFYTLKKNTQKLNFLSEIFEVFAWNVYIFGDN